MHKLTKTLMHVWLSLASVLGFVFGWAFVAHAQKPAPLIAPEVQTIAYNQPELQPIPTLNDYLSNSAFVAPVFQNPTVSLPRLRTRGS